MNSDPVIVECTLNVPVDKVWKAITDKDEMVHWYFHMNEFRLEPGFEFQFWESEEQKYLHRCKIITVIPARKLAYTWRFEGYPGDSLLTFELFPAGAKTRLSVTHSGLENFPSDVPELAKENFREGWNFIVHKSLKEYIEGQ